MLASAFGCVLGGEAGVEEECSAEVVADATTAASTGGERAGEAGCETWTMLSTAGMTSSLGSARVCECASVRECPRSETIRLGEKVKESSLEAVIGAGGQVRSRTVNSRM